MKVAIVPQAIPTPYVKARCGLLAVGPRFPTVSGQARAEASGGGRIEVEGGHGQTLRANASGGGRIAYDGGVGSLSASASGGGQVAVATAQEVVSRSESGGGRVEIGD